MRRIAEEYNNLTIKVAEIKVEAVFTLQLTHMYSGDFSQKLQYVGQIPLPEREGL